MRLIALQEVCYAGRTRYPANEKTGKPADDFDASDEDARILKGLGKATDAPEPGAKTAAPKTAAPPKAADAPPPATTSQQPKRRYQRRDMTAEE